MSCILDKRKEENYAREEYGSVRNLFSIFLKSLFKKYLPLQFPIYELKRFQTIGMKYMKSL